MAKATVDVRRLEAFTNEWQQVELRLKCYAQCRLGCPDKAEEALQSTSLKLLMGGKWPHDFPEGGHRYFYAQKQLDWVIKDEFRAARSNESSNLNTSEHTFESQVPGTIDPPVLEAQEEAERRARFAEVVREKLNEFQVRVFELQESGHKPETIAEILDQDVSVVYEANRIIKSVQYGALLTHNPQVLHRQLPDLTDCFLVGVEKARLLDSRWLVALGITRAGKPVLVDVFDGNTKVDHSVVTQWVNDWKTRGLTVPAGLIFPELAPTVTADYIIAPKVCQLPGMSDTQLNTDTVRKTVLRVARRILIYSSGEPDQPLIRYALRCAASCANKVKGHQDLPSLQTAIQKVCSSAGSQPAAASTASSANGP
ncbi:MAG TPA: hypothetical protein PKC18_03020 [Lacipirellulaceae bacterium]|nr:hypothetical protein [Lacipirellulaceae bacterium]HMP07710.1 hypothetical protein [Lacipirellulaceae bacterium]